MTRYSDLIAHLQAHIEKHGDQPFAVGGGHSYAAFYMYAKMAEQAKGLNKAVQRRNVRIKALAKRVSELEDAIAEIHRNASNITVQMEIINRVLPQSAGKEAANG